MKNNIKEIITEAVLGFLNEVKPSNDKKTIPVDFSDDPQKFNVPIKGASKQKTKIHPSFHKPTTQQTKLGVNEEELPDTGSLFDENTRKKFLKAIQIKDR